MWSTTKCTYKMEITIIEYQFCNFFNCRTLLHDRVVRGESGWFGKRVKERKRCMASFNWMISVILLCMVSSWHDRIMMLKMNDAGKGYCLQKHWIYFWHQRNDERYFFPHLPGHTMYTAYIQRTSFVEQIWSKCQETVWIGFWCAIALNIDWKTIHFCGIASESMNYKKSSELLLVVFLIFFFALLFLSPLNVLVLSK